MDNPDDLLPDAKAAQRYGVHPKSLPRWDRRREQAAERGADLAREFPAPIVINNRKYRRVGDLQRFERANVVRPTPPKVRRERATAAASPTDTA
jgi:hypothetical protein